MLVSPSIDHVQASLLLLFAVASAWGRHHAKSVLFSTPRNHGVPHARSQAIMDTPTKSYAIVDSGHTYPSDQYGPFLTKAQKIELHNEFSDTLKQLQILRDSVTTTYNVCKRTKAFTKGNRDIHAWCRETCKAANEAKKVADKAVASLEAGLTMVANAREVDGVVNRTDDAIEEDQDDVATDTSSIASAAPSDDQNSADEASFASSQESHKRRPLLDLTGIPRDVLSMHSIPKEWTQPVLDYIRGCFDKKSQIPGIDREQIKSRLKLVIDDVLDRRDMDSTRWDKVHTPQQAIQHERNAASAQLPPKPDISKMSEKQKKKAKRNQKRLQRGLISATQAKSTQNLLVAPQSPA